MSDDELTLEELGRRSGVRPRTLRSWVSEGLLSPPFKPGRGARYPASNADRALAVRALKEVHGLSLSEIGRQLMMESDEQIRKWALEADTVGMAQESALEYLRRNQESAEDEGKQGTGWKRQHGSRAATGTGNLHLQQSAPPGQRARTGDGPAEIASLRRLILELVQVVGGPAPRSSRGTVWTRIPITPNLEISVRGALDPGERVLFEQLADQMRVVLAGGTRKE